MNEIKKNETCCDITDHNLHKVPEKTKAVDT